MFVHCLRINHRFSMGLWSMEFPGHGPKISMFCLTSHLVIAYALWHGAPSCWKKHRPKKHHQIAPGSLGEVALGGCFDTILYSWQCSKAKLWVSPLLWMRSNPTHESLLKGCFTVGMTRDSWWRSPFLLQTISCPKKSKWGFIRENNFTPVLYSPTPVLPA